MYGDQFGEFACEYWGLKGLRVLATMTVMVMRMSKKEIGLSSKKQLSHFFSVTARLQCESA